MGSAMRPFPVPLLLVLVLALVAIYISYYFRAPRNPEILQTTLRNFRLDSLHERHPIVFADRVPPESLPGLGRAWFGTNMRTAWSIEAPAEADAPWARNRFKYLLLDPEAPMTVVAAPPGTRMGTDGAPDPETTTLLAIRLRENQPMILPFRWHYRFLPHKDTPVRVDGIGAHDLITYFL